MGSTEQASHEGASKASFDADPSQSTTEDANRNLASYELDADDFMSFLGMGEPQPVESSKPAPEQNKPGRKERDKEAVDDYATLFDDLPDLTRPEAPFEDYSQMPSSFDDVLFDRSKDRS